MIVLDGVEIVAGDRYVHVVNFFDDAAGASASDLSDRTFKMQVRRDTTPVAQVLEEFTLTVVGGTVTGVLTEAQTRNLWALVSVAGMDFQEVISADGPDTLWARPVTITGDYTR